MGNKISLRVLVIGLDNSGKTTAIYQLAGKQDMIDSIEKTVGFDVEEVRTSKAKFDMWDVAGGANVREVCCLLLFIIIIFYYYYYYYYYYY